MPFQVGSVAMHDDGQHTGSAKRAGASGVAPLDATSLVPLAYLSGITNTEISATAAIAKTKLAALGIVDADVDAGAAIAMSKLSLAITNAQVAAGAAIAVSKLEAGVAKIVTTNYVGNNTVNRAIAHGGGATPRFGFCLPGEATHGWLSCLLAGTFKYVSHLEAIALAVTAWDSTNIYVGNATAYYATGNELGSTYYWVLFF